MIEKLIKVGDVMGQIKRKRPWEKKESPPMIQLIAQECIWQCIICMIILISTVCILQFSDDKTMLYLLDEEINKTLQKEELYFVVEFFEDIIYDERK